MSVSLRGIGHCAIRCGRRIVARVDIHEIRRRLGNAFADSFNGSFAEIRDDGFGRRGRLKSW